MNGNGSPSHGSGAATTDTQSSLTAASMLPPAAEHDEESSIRHHPTMLPPGFSGDSLRAEGGGTASAPPPGFHHDARADQRRRDQAAAMMLLQHRPPPNHAGLSLHQQQHQQHQQHQQQQRQQQQHQQQFQQRHVVDGGDGGPGPGLSLSGGLPDPLIEVDGGVDGGKRTTSFVNLAQALGESMAQVMDDSLLGRSNHGAASSSYNNGHNLGALNSTHAPIVEDDPLSSSDLYGGGTSSPSPPGTLANKEKNRSSAPAPHHSHHHAGESYGIDNYQRQSRHISSRLIGPKTGHNHLSSVGSTAGAVSFLSPGSGGFYASVASTQQQQQISTSRQNGLGSEEGGPPGDTSVVKLSQHTGGVMSAHRNSVELLGASGSSNHRENDRRSSGDSIPTDTSSPPPGAGLETQRRRMEASLALTGGDAPAIGVGGKGDGFMATSSPDRQRQGAEAVEAAEEVLLRGGPPFERGRSSAPPELQLFGAAGTPFGHHLRQGPSPSHNGAAPPSTVHKPVGLPLGEHNQQNRSGGHGPPSAALIGGGSLTPSPNTILDLPDRTTIASTSSSTSSSSSPSMQFHVDTADPSRATERELAPFLREAMQSGGEQPSVHPSRGLAVLLSTGAARQLALSDVRAGCEAFGSIESFRSDFWHTRGVIFLSYYDLRCAQRAAADLPAFLRRLMNAGTTTRWGSSESETAQEPRVKYCIPLQSSAPTDESTILVCNLPEDMDEQRLTAFMESFGGVRTVQYQMMSAGGIGGQGVDDDFDGPSYVVEFFDVQDAKQALLELQHAEPWGPCVQVEVGMRNPTKRRQAKDLLRLLGRWRLGSGSGSVDGASHGDSRVSARRSSRQNVSSPSNAAFIQRVPSRTPPPADTSGSVSAPLSMAAKTKNEHFQSSHKKDAAKISTPVSISPMPSATTSSPSSHGHRPMDEDSSAHTHRMYNPVHAHHESRQSQQQSHTQLVLGPNGQYSYVTVSSLPVPGGVAPQYTSHGQPYFPSPHHEQQPHYPSPQYAYVHDPHSHHHPGMQHHVSMPGHSAPQLVMPSYIDVRTGYPVNPVYLPVSGSNADSSVSSGGSGHPSQTSFSTDQKNRSRTAVVEKKGQCAKARKVSVGAHGGVGTDDPALALDIDVVKSGRDVRTSLMVRNIPNKYTQKMLLEEFTDGGHGPDKMDFFYLPIDFKNKCNRGYAFVNFVDYRDIVAFHSQYNGNQWKVFNSDKICQITYARIQGKAAMLKRFEHSALLDKEVEYRPLVFYSHGPNKGEREPFPSSSGNIDQSPS